MTTSCSHIAQNVVPLNGDMVSRSPSTCYTALWRRAVPLQGNVASPSAVSDSLNLDSNGLTSKAFKCTQLGNIHPVVKT